MAEIEEARSSVIAIVCRARPGRVGHKVAARTQEDAL